MSDNPVPRITLDDGANLKRYGPSPQSILDQDVKVSNSPIDLPLFPEFLHELKWEQPDVQVVAPLMTLKDADGPGSHLHHSAPPVYPAAAPEASNQLRVVPVPPGAVPLTDKLTISFRQLGARADGVSLGRCLSGDLKWMHASDSAPFAGAPFTSFKLQVRWPGYHLDVVTIPAVGCDAKGRTKHITRAALARIVAAKIAYSLTLASRCQCRQREGKLVLGTRFNNGVTPFDVFFTSLKLIGLVPGTKTPIYMPEMLVRLPTMPSIRSTTQTTRKLLRPVLGAV